MPDRFPTGPMVDARGYPNAGWREYFRRLQANAEPTAFLALLGQFPRQKREDLGPRLFPTLAKLKTTRFQVRTATWANKGNHNPVDSPPGSLLVITDHPVVFVNDAGVWRYLAGAMTDALTNRPSTLTTPAIGANDAGLRFVSNDTDQNTEYVWSGTEWWTIGGYLQEVLDAVSQSDALVLRHRSTGTPGANFSVQQGMELDNDANQVELAAVMEALWSDASDGNETSDWALHLRDAGGALTRVLRAFAAGHLRLLLAGALLQFEGATSSHPAIKRNSANLEARLADDSAGTGMIVADEAYDATGWDGSLEVPTKNAVRDEMENKADAVSPGGGGPGSYTTLTRLDVNGEGIVTHIEGS